MPKIVEIISYLDINFEESPLDLQNIVFSVLDKIKKENNKLKIKGTNKFERSIKRDALELLDLVPVVSDKESDFIVQIFEDTKYYSNKGLNIIVNLKNEKIRIKRITR